MSMPAGAGSGGTDVQQQFLSLIRNFASEKSQGERRVSDLKRRFLDLQMELEEANAGLESAKQVKEEAEHVLKGFEVELAMADASVISLETRTRLLQQEVSRVTTELNALKNEESDLRNGFINEMFDLNKKIRDFQKTEVLLLKNKDCTTKQSEIKDGKDTTQDMPKTIEDEMSDITGHLHVLEQRYQGELRAQDEVLRVLADAENRALLGEAVMEETKQLQDLARYPWQRAVINFWGYYVR